MNRENVFLISSHAFSGRYREEDLLTDNFGSFLNLDGQFARTWFELVTGTTPKSIKVTTQPPFQEYPNDAPDMILETPEGVLICENKLGSPLGDKQLERYLDLVRTEKARTRLPHYLALVGKDRISIPQSVINSRYYCHPKGATHFFWQDIYHLLTKNLDDVNEAPVISKLRIQFLEYLHFLHLSPIVLPNGCPPLSGDFSPEEKAQQRAFGEAWWSIRDWFEQKGYRTNPSSRIALYVWPTPFSEILNSRGIHHFLIEPNEGKDIPRNAKFLPPILKFNITLEERANEFGKRLLDFPDLHLDFLNLPLSVQRQKQLSGQIRVSFMVPLNPLFEYINIREALKKVVEEIYIRIILPAISDELSSFSQG